MEHPAEELPERVRRVLDDFVSSAKVSLSTNLKSVVLYGSAAEGRLRATSDVNLVLVLEKFDVSQVNDLREKIRAAHAAIQLNIMFLLASEIPLATEAFAVKFADILSRHQVLFGEDFFNSLVLPREVTLQRLRQVILNLNLRLRERYAMVSLREEQLATVIAETAGPVRACAATILSLEGNAAVSPKEALQILAGRLPGGDRASLLEKMSMARELRRLNPGDAQGTVVGILDLLQAMHRHVLGLS
jgi:predicted nucleotidyltransferase